MEDKIGVALIKRKELLQEDILQYVTRMLNGFREETGCGVSSIDIEFIDVAVAGDIKLKWKMAPGSCRVKVVI